jgi:hypothetical protein
MAWRVRIDFNEDGDFTDAGEDISARVIEARWQIGQEAEERDGNAIHLPGRQVEPGPSRDAV